MLRLLEQRPDRRDDRVVGSLGPDPVEQCTQLLEPVDGMTPQFFVVTTHTLCMRLSARAKRQRRELRSAAPRIPGARPRSSRA